MRLLAGVSCSQFFPEDVDKPDEDPIGRRLNWRLEGEGVVVGVVERTLMRDFLPYNVSRLSDRANLSMAPARFVVFPLPAACRHAGPAGWIR